MSESNGPSNFDQPNEHSQQPLYETQYNPANLGSQAMFSHVTNYATKSVDNQMFERISRDNLQAHTNLSKLSNLLQNMQ